MHEMAYVRNVVDVVNEYADRDDVAEVAAVHLTIGEGRDVVVDYFQGLFQFLARGTKAEHAEMVVRRTPFAVSCNRCATVFPLDVFDESSWKCPSCGAVRDYRMHSGMEFRIDRIEVKGTGTGKPNDDAAVSESAGESEAAATLACEAAEAPAAVGA